MEHCQHPSALACANAMEWRPKDRRIQVTCALLPPNMPAASTRNDFGCAWAGWGKHASKIL